MKIRDITIRAGRSLKHAKARTLLTSLAIGVGAFTIVLSLALGAGGRAYAEDIIKSNTDVRQIMVQTKQDESSVAGISTKPQKYSDDPTISYGGGVNIKLLKQSDIDKIKSVSGVESVTPYYMVTPKYIVMSGQDKYLVSAETYQESIKLDYVAGSADGIEDSGAIVPEGYGEVFGYNSAKDFIGQTIQVAIESGSSNPLKPEIKLFNYKVVGVIKQSALAVVNGSNSIQIYKDDMKEMYDYEKKGTYLYGTYMAATVLAKPNVNVDDVKAGIKAEGYAARTAEDIMGFIFQFINVLQGILIGFGVLAVLTSVFGIINTQYISVLERTQQIGLMKALGMRRRDVGRLFKFEAAWIGFLGGMIGSVLAVVLGNFANPLISEWLSIGETRLIIFEPLSVVLVVVGLVLVSVASGILPARKASKLNPIEALRTE